ncbi:hypothetical protein QAD02_019747 [Eretmocerus hayati]|uniref:Uncharacterized protein n=1 Tax=Eretmocerus hayati TaxID=131215 RepID=A0ACC2PQ96_9HYME|nr:hypothetical protein QAD02_019747 [Eretmocerus hayati]
MAKGRKLIVEVCSPYLKILYKEYKFLPQSILAFKALLEYEPRSSSHREVVVAIAITKFETWLRERTKYASQGQPPPNSDQHHHHHGPDHAIPKLEPVSTPPLHQDSHEVGQLGSHGHQGAPVVAVCAGCGLKISDRFYLEAVDRRWHASCLQCCHCRRGLDGEVTCFSKEGNIYCKKDYYSMFGSMRRCSRCRAGISAKELVMRVRDLVFHVGCFSCAACGIALKRGDQFGMREGAVLCRLHYEMEATAEQLRPAQSPPLPLGYAPGPHYPGPHPSYPSPEFLHHPLHRHPASGQPPSMHPVQSQQQPVTGQVPGGPQAQGPQQPQMSPVPMQPGTPIGGEAGSSPPKMPYFNGASPVVAAAAQQVQVPPPRQKGRPRKRKPKDLEAMTASLGESYLSADYMDMPFGRGPGTPGMPGSNSRTKRMRTSFKHHQLRTMKSYFAINHNPDAKDLKQLSQKTGLPKRVLQVWFQNARAKWRRMVLKQEGKSDKCGGSGPGGSLGPGGGMHDPAGLSDLELYGSGSGGGPPMSPNFVLGGPHSPASLGSSLDCA